VAPISWSASGCVIQLSSTPAPDAGPSVTGNEAGNAGDAGNVGNQNSTTPDGGVIIDLDFPDSGAPWANVTSNLASLISQCGNLTYVAAKRDEDLLIAGVAGDGLWGSRNGGQTWTVLGDVDAGSAGIDNRPSDIVFDPATSNQWWESGIYGSLGGIYVTMNDGVTFAGLGTVLYNDTVSVDFTDPQRKTLLAGAHETPQRLWQSLDQGMTWTDIGAALPAGDECPNPYIIDSQIYLVGCNRTSTGGQSIYRSADGGGTWTLVSSEGGMYAALQASDGSIYWGSPDGALVRSTDEGQTWTTTVPKSTLSFAAPVELPDGRIASLSSNASNQIVVSSDHGSTWKAVTPSLPPVADGGNGWVGLAYSAQRKMFLAWWWSCPPGNGAVPVPSNAIMSYAFDYQSP
jgi:hypothetical protein